MKGGDESRGRSAGILDIPSVGCSFLTSDVYSSCALLVTAGLCTDANFRAYRGSAPQDFKVATSMIKTSKSLAAEAAADPWGLRRAFFKGDLYS